MYTTHSNVSTTTKKAGLVVLAHGKMLNDEKKVTIVSAYDASLPDGRIMYTVRHPPGFCRHSICKTSSADFQHPSYNPPVFFLILSQNEIKSNISF